MLKIDIEPFPTPFIKFKYILNAVSINLAAMPKGLVTQCKAWINAIKKMRKTVEFKFLWDRTKWKKIVVTSA